MSDPRTNMAGMAAQFNKNNSDNMNVANLHGQRLCNIPGGAYNPALMGQPLPKKRATTKQNQNQTAWSGVTVVNGTSVQNYQKQQQPTGGMQMDPATGAGFMPLPPNFQQRYAPGNGTLQVPQQQHMMMRPSAPGMINFANMGPVNGARTQTPMSNVQAPAQSPMQNPAMINAFNPQAPANGVRVQARMMGAQTPINGVRTQTPMSSVQTPVQTPVMVNAQVPANGVHAQTPMGNARTSPMGHAQAPVHNPQGVQQQSQCLRPTAPSFIPAQNDMAPQQAQAPQANMQQRVAQPVNKKRSMTPQQAEAIQKQMDLLQNVQNQQNPQIPLDQGHLSTPQPAKQTPELGAMPVQKSDGQTPHDFRSMQAFYDKIRANLVNLGAPPMSQKKAMELLLSDHGVTPGSPVGPRSKQTLQSLMQRLTNGPQPGEPGQQFNARQNFVAQQPVATPLLNAAQPKAGKQTKKDQPKTPKPKKPKAKKLTKKELAERAERAKDPSSPDYVPLPPSARPLIRVEPKDHDEHGMPVTPEADARHVYWTSQPNELTAEQIDHFVKIVRDENAGLIPKEPSQSETNKKRRTKKASPETVARPIATATPAAAQQDPSSGFTGPTPQAVPTNGLTNQSSPINGFTPQPVSQSVSANGFTQPAPQAIPTNGFTQPAGNTYQTNGTFSEASTGADSYLASPAHESLVNDFILHSDENNFQTNGDSLQTSTDVVDPTLQSDGVSQDGGQVNDASAQAPSGTPTGFTDVDNMGDFFLLSPLVEATQSAPSEGASVPQNEDDSSFIDDLLAENTQVDPDEQAFIDAVSAQFAKDNNTSSQALTQQDSLQSENAVQPGQMRKVSDNLLRLSRETSPESVTVADETPVTVSTPVAANTPVTVSTPASVSTPVDANTPATINTFDSNCLVGLAALIRPGMSTGEVFDLMSQVSNESYFRGGRDASQLAASQSTQDQRDGVSNQVQDDNNNCAHFDSSSSRTPSPGQVSSVLDASSGNGFSSSLPSSPEVNASVTEPSLVTDQSAVTKPSYVTESTSVTGPSIGNFASSNFNDFAGTKSAADNTLVDAELFADTNLSVNMNFDLGYGENDEFNPSPLMEEYRNRGRFINPSLLDSMPYSPPFEQRQLHTAPNQISADPQWGNFDPNLNLFSND